MHFNLALLAFIVPLVSAAITINVPTNPQSSTSVTITWSGFNPVTDPPAVTIELKNPQFNNAFGLANNIDTSTGSLTVLLPSVPASDQYVIEFVNIGNINDVFASSATFFIAGPASGSAQSTSSTSSNASSSAGTVKTTAVTTSTSLTTTTSSFGVIVTSSTASSTTSSGALTSSTAPANTVSGSAPATTFSGALSSRLSLGSYTSVLAMVFSAVAGAAIVAL